MTIIVKLYVFRNGNKIQMIYSISSEQLFIEIKDRINFCYSKQVELIKPEKSLSYKFDNDVIFVENGGDNVNIKRLIKIGRNTNSTIICIGQPHKGVTSLSLPLLLDEIMSLKLGGVIVNEHRDILGNSEHTKNIHSTIKLVAPSDSTVLVLGESGVGKEVVSNRIHELSTRKSMPFIAINCGAIPENLFESELFGYKKGSFTGAFSDKPGKIEEAHGGTLFLDEIGELPPQMQTKLLRVIQERKVQRIGENTERDIDIRIITATNKDLKKNVENGDFREDLYYRINVIPINIKPLRERKEDIIPLINHFSNSKSYGKLSFDKDAIDELVKYGWPGNVRELVNIVERVSVFFKHSVVSRENIIDILGFDEIKVSAIVNDIKAKTVVISEELPIKALNAIGLKDAVNNFESKIIMEALDNNGWKVTKASEVLGVKRTTLLEKIKRLGLSK